MRQVFFFRSQLGQYAFSLVLSKWFSALSGLITLKWIREGGITTGSYCASQGALHELGEFGSAFFVVAMGLHTFNTLVLHNRQPQWVGPLVVALGWAGALGISATPITMTDRAGGPLYNVGHLSCGFSRMSPVAHMILFFLPMFLGSLLSAFVYSLIFLVLRGTITINGGLRFQLDPENRLRLRNQTFEEYQRFIYSVARTMLWLPTTFILTLFPSSVVQSMDISGISVSTASVVFSCILVYLGGIIDVFILFNILKVLGFAVKSQNSNVPSDSEKGRSKLGPISRPTYDWKPQASPQAQFTRTAPPARPPSTILQESAPRPLSFGRLLFRPHKKSGSSSTRLLTPELLSRNHSPSSSLNGSKISATESDLPPFPAPAVPRDSPVDSTLSDYVRRVPAPSSVGSQAVIPREGVVSPPEVALSIGAAAARGYGSMRQLPSIPDSPPAPVVSPGDSTDASHYSDTESWTPQEPEPSLVLPVLQPTRPLRFSRGTKLNAGPERHLLDPPQSSRISLDPSMPRALPTLPSRPGRQRSSSVYSPAGSMVLTHSRQGSSSSSFSGYI